MAKNPNYTEKDNGFNAFISAFEKKKGETDVFVGMLRSSGTYSPEKGKGPAKPITMAQLGAIIEFGSKDGTIPERAPMRTTMATIGQKLEKLCQGLALKVVQGETTSKKALGMVGEFVKNSMKRTITQQAFPNVERSKAYDRRQRAKGKNKTLIDTGQYINAIDWQVRSNDPAKKGSE